jgi:hypothetical protein
MDLENQKPTVKVTTSENDDTEFFEIPHDISASMASDDSTDDVCTSSVYLTWRDVSFFVPAKVGKNNQAEKNGDVTVDAKLLNVDAGKKDSAGFLDSI